MATTTTLGRAAQPPLSYRYPRRPPSPSSHFDCAVERSQRSSATVDMDQTSHSPPVASTHTLCAQWKTHQDLGARGIKRNIDVAEAEVSKRDDNYSSYSTSTSFREAGRGSQLPPSSTTTASFPAIPSMRMQLPSFNVLSPGGGALSDDPILKKPRGGYLLDGSSRSSQCFHLAPRSLNGAAISPAISTTAAADESQPSQHQYHQPLPPRSTGLLPRARTNELLSPLSTYDGSPSHRKPQPSSTPERSSSSTPQSDQQQQGSGQPAGETAYASASSYDGSSVPLSMRRGNVAHAKASRLHIDVPAPPSSSSSAPSAVEANSAGGPPPPGNNRPPAPHDEHWLATNPHVRSQGAGGSASVDPRGEGSRPSEGRCGPDPPSQSRRRHHHQRLHIPHSAQSRSHPTELPNGVEGIDGAAASTLPPQSRPDVESSVNGTAEGGPSNASYQQGDPLRGAAPPVSTPISSRFAPHTATFPSPAYHTTRLVGASSNENGSGHLAYSHPPRTSTFPSSAPLAPNSLPNPSCSTSPTAQALASKGQFLSLFSSFYDSLSDSRTLKLTLEDQVRRSNALIQTLQKSTRVLEATVERKLREERSVWETRLERLEGEVRDLKGRLAEQTVGEEERQLNNGIQDLPNKGKSHSPSPSSFEPEAEADDETVGEPRRKDDN